MIQIRPETLEVLVRMADELAQFSDQTPYRERHLSIAENLLAVHRQEQKVVDDNAMVEQEVNGNWGTWG